jgi:hypothetical protein
MTKLAIFTLGLMLAFVSVQAQQSNKVVTLALAHECAPANQVLPFLKEKFGEEPFALGRASVTVANNGKIVEGVLLMSANPKTLTYTINILFEEEDMICMLAAGDNFQPAYKQSNNSL